MAGAIVIEGVSTALGVSRNELAAFFYNVEKRLGRVRGQLARRVDAIMAGPGSNSERVDSLVSYSRAAVGGFDRDAVKLVLGIAGTIWGMALVNAGVGVTISCTFASISCK